MRKRVATNCFWVFLVHLLAISIASPAATCPEKPATWTDPSHHKLLFVTVAPDVKLEVLEWGGTGRPLVLLAGWA